MVQRFRQLPENLYLTGEGLRYTIQYNVFLVFFSIFLCNYRITSLSFDAQNSIHHSSHQITSLNYQPFFIKKTPLDNKTRSLYSRLFSMQTQTNTSYESKTLSTTRARQETKFLLPNQKPLKMDLTQSFSKTLLNRGVSRIDSCVSTKTVGNLREYIDKTLEQSITEVGGYKVPRAFRFANVLEKKHRWDLLLPFKDITDGGGKLEIDESTKLEMESMRPLMSALDELLAKDGGGTIGPIIESVLGPDAVLYELACLISDPGAQGQEIHPDILFQKDADNIPLIACFVSLQNIESNMGPTIFLPDTVTEYHHHAINNVDLSDDMLRSAPSYLNVLGEGDCSLYNPLLLHAGGANESSKRRRLFYVTFRNAAYSDPSHDLNPGSIRPDLKNLEMSLNDMREKLQIWREQNELLASCH